VLVYGDRSREVAPLAQLAAVRAALARAAATAGLARADRLTEALILAGELAQGVADAEAETRGGDDITPVASATLDLAISVAARLLAAVGQPPAMPDDPAAPLARVAALPLPGRIRLRMPEGYAYYAVYPEAYAAAAAVAWERPPLVIGLRSIGTSLAAAVAARLGSPALTVRPVGHPLRRELRLSEALRQRLRAHGGCFLVVDEGPGVSGSSFGCVADALQALGVVPERIVFMPSHATELGPLASAAHRARWARSRRLTGAAPVSAPVVAGWFADIVGSAVQAQDLSGGAWRRDLPKLAWPPAAPAGERLKFRLTGAHGRFIARFAGLGGVGEAKLAVARRLHAAGFAAEPLALRRGFLLERWVDGEPLRAADRRVLAHLGRYLGFRACALPATGDGADVATLASMAIYNAGELGGPGLAGCVERQLAAIERLPGLVPAQIDARLHPWEWLRTADGGLCKTDALDHAAAHDLVGCQDIAWDVAGAAVELGLSPAATEWLRGAVGDAAGRPVSAEAVAAFRFCYAAFQGGLWHMLGEGDGDGAARTRRRVQACLAELRGATGTAPPPERSPSLVVP
jgi:hypothetical protein